MLEVMLNPSDITQPGFYWYVDELSGDPVVVEVGPPDAARHDLEVRFTGRDDADSLQELAGAFFGPIQPPL